MGVDVSAVAGWGVVLSEEFIEEFIENYHCRDEDLCPDECTCIIDMGLIEVLRVPNGLHVRTFGSEYSGHIGYAILSRDEATTRGLIDKLNDMIGTDFVEADVKWIETTLYW